jgi:hypothetical protein
LAVCEFDARFLESTLNCPERARARIVLSGLDVLDSHFGNPRRFR